MEPLYKKEEVAYFLAKFHEKYYNEKISKIKLQKGLYFLYAYYSQFVYRGTDSEIGDDFPKNLSRELFKPDFQAWSYGPVDYSIYKKYDEITNNTSKCNIEVFLKKSENEFVSDYLDTLTRQILNSTDFGLVELSHQDQSWSNHYHQHEQQHREKIPAEEILNEYEY